MTLADGKRKVLMLLDEYSSGGEITEDPDIMNKMNDLFDMAQKDMSVSQPVVATEEIELDPSGYTDLPENFSRCLRTWKDGKQISSFPVAAGKLLSGNCTGAITLEYIKIPSRIDENTSDNYEFEVNELAANVLPFYVAAQQLVVDLVVDYSALWNMYVIQKAQLPSCIPSDGRVVQTFYRG